MSSNYCTGVTWKPDAVSLLVSRQLLWEQLWVPKGLLIHCIVNHMVTDGVCKQKPDFVEIFVLKVGPQFGHLYVLYHASRLQSFTKMSTWVCSPGHFQLTMQSMEEITDLQVSLVHSPWKLKKVTAFLQAIFQLHSCWSNLKKASLFLCCTIVFSVGTLPCFCSNVR